MVTNRKGPETGWSWELLWASDSQQSRQDRREQLGAPRPHRYKLPSGVLNTALLQSGQCPSQTLSTSHFTRHFYTSHLSQTSFSLRYWLTFHLESPNQVYREDLKIKSKHKDIEMQFGFADHFFSILEFILCIAAVQKQVEHHQCSMLLCP